MVEIEDAYLKSSVLVGVVF